MVLLARGLTLCVPFALSQAAAVADVKWSGWNLAQCIRAPESEFYCVFTVCLAF